MPTVRRALLVPPRFEGTFPLRAGRASPPQNGGVAVTRDGQWVAEPAAEHGRDGSSATLPIDEWPLPHRTFLGVPMMRDAVYLGVALSHFGHFLSESIHRTWALRDARVGDRVRGVMLLPHGIDEPQPFQRETLAMMGIDPARVVWVRTPTRVARLRVPALASRFGEPAPSHYLDERRAVALNTLGEVPPVGAIYLHKPLHHGRSVVAGAGWLAEQLAAHGVRTVVPETLPVREQVRIVAGATHVMAHQGSALRILEVLGRVDAPISVVAQRGSHDRLRLFLEGRSPDLALAEGIRMLPPPPGISASTWRFAGLAQFEPDGLEEFVRRRLGIPFVLDRQALRAAEDADIERWMEFAPALYVNEDEIRAGLRSWRASLSSSEPEGRGSTAR